jgi:hypothetical protein
VQQPAQEALLPPLQAGRLCRLRWRLQMKGRPIYCMLFICAWCARRVARCAVLRSLGKFQVNPGPSALQVIA